MVMSQSEAVSAYRDGLDQVGEGAYRTASNADTVVEAARALEEAGEDASVDFGRYERNYREKYS